jgi:serine/threonine protein kinase
MSPALPVLGQTLGPYRLVQGIGLGGKSAVFRGLDERSQRTVAVKLPIEGALAGDVARDRLRREAAALGRIDHPGVPRLLGHGSQDGIDFLVMEYVEGPTLAGRLRERGPLEEPALLALALRIAAVLAAVHRRGVIHCDLKPGNVILGPDGGLKLLDFGQARLAGDRALAPGESFREAAGTVSYMAPERFLRRRPDPRADLWSLGVLLYETATGRRPFRGEGPDAIIRAIRRETPEPPSAHAPRLSPRFDRVALKALEKDPDRRYQTAGGMGRALARARSSSAS